MDVERTESLKRKRDDDDGPGDRFGGARAVAVPAPLPTGKHPYSHYLLAGEDIVRGRVVDILYNNKPEKKFEWVEGIVALIGKPGGEHQNQICVHATGKGYHAWLAKTSNELAPAKKYSGDPECQSMSYEDAKAAPTSGHAVDTSSPSSGLGLGGAGTRDSQDQVKDGDVEMESAEGSNDEPVDPKAERKH